jgi:lysylphosphatidylglycerol synthetase-like protein (DUF2156 family)
MILAPGDFHRRVRVPVWMVSVPRYAPLTLGFVALLWVVAGVTGSLVHGPSAALSKVVGIGPTALTEGRWWTPLTAAMWCPGLFAYIITTVLLLGLVAPAERRLGTARTAMLLVGTQVIGTVAGSLVIGLAARAGDRWSEQMAAGLTLGPSAAAVAVILAVSSHLTTLWRRRLRLSLLLGLALLVAYSGHLQDVLRLATGAAGLMAGPALQSRAPHLPGQGPTRPERRLLVAVVVAALAVGPLIAALSAAPIGPLAVLRYVFLSPPPDAAAVQQICATPASTEDCRALQAQLRLTGIGPAIMSLMPVILLLIAADGLRRGRRAAWWAAVLTNLVLAALGILLAAELLGTHAEQRVVFGGLLLTQNALSIVLPLAVPLLVMGLLLGTRRSFDVRAPQGTYQRLAASAAVTLGVVSLIYVGTAYLLRHQFDRPPSVAALLADLPTRFIPPGYLGEIEPVFLPEGTAATVLYEWTGPVFLLVITIRLIGSLRRTHEDVTDTSRARDLLVERGGSSLSYMTLWAGNSYWFTPDGRSAIAYRVQGTVALTTGGPIGSRINLTETITGFSDFCTRHGWTPCLYSVTDDVRDAVSILAWRSVQVAEETIIPLPELAFTGKKWQDVRTALNNATKKGITAQWIQYRHAPLSITDQIRRISEEWVTDKGLPEMGFTLGGLDELDDDHIHCLIAVDGDHIVHGVTSWMPVYHEGIISGWTLDFMRRSATGFPGVMEFLIASAAIRFRDEHTEFVSLSGAPLARIQRGQPPDLLQKLLDLLGRTLEPVYGFHSLLHFKAKFQPTYRPLWMVYPDPMALPTIANAISRAYLPNLTTRQATRMLRALNR